jgi:hypothetical protein
MRARPPVLPSLFMGKFKPARGKNKKRPVPPAGLACVVLILVGMGLVMLFLYMVMRGAA